MSQPPTKINTSTLDVNQLIYNGGLIDANKNQRHKQNTTATNGGLLTQIQNQSAVLLDFFYKSVIYFDIKQEQLDLS
jgi:hypothetical protein